MNLVSTLRVFETPFGPVFDSELPAALLSAMNACPQRKFSYKGHRDWPDIYDKRHKAYAAAIEAHKEAETFALSYAMDRWENPKPPLSARAFPAGC
jgi:hypothetical protein